MKPARLARNRKYATDDDRRKEYAARARARYASTKDSRPGARIDRSTTLYRFFDRDGVLIYVGITYDFKVRLTQHRRRSEWFEAVNHWATETYPTRRAAKRVETQSIREERPKFNLHESIL